MHAGGYLGALDYNGTKADTLAVAHTCTVPGESGAGFPTRAQALAL